MCLWEATEEELQHAKTPRVNGKDSRKHSRPAATPSRARPGPEASEPNSGNPAELKRHRMKRPDPDKDRQIAELKKAEGFEGWFWNVLDHCILFNPSFTENTVDL